METEKGDAIPASACTVPTSGTDYQVPNWDRCTEEVLCPLCQYNLRGLTDPRCPECGYKFQWPDLLDPARREHPYLFELRPKNNFSSFWKTAYHGLRPGKFWTVLRADQRSNPRRLMIYWFIIAAVVLLAFAGDYFVQELNVEISYERLIKISPRMYYYTTPMVDRYPLRDFMLPALVILSWPWFTYLSLSVFQISMRRAKVKQSHVRRCVVYSSDAFLWPALIALLVSLIRAVEILVNDTVVRPYASTIFETPLIEWALYGLMVLSAIYRLSVAYWRYLRFSHVVPTILASQLIVVLAMLATLTYLAMAKIIR